VQEIMTYCTGGIRCETAGPLLSKAAPHATIYTLQGGIQMYMDYVTSFGKKSLYKGANYVFDARQALVGPSSSDSVPQFVPCSQCIVCGVATAHYIKCRCFSIIVCCRDCAASTSPSALSSSLDVLYNASGSDGFQVTDLAQSAVFCCNACKEGKRPCDCERSRANALGIKSH
jgi:predicted sulfurtransferase